MPESEVEFTSWHDGSAPRYIGLFLLVVFFDQLAPVTLGVGGLLPSIGGAGLGGLVAFVLLYWPLAWWGYRTRRGFDTLSERTFGVAGARYLVGPIVALIQVGWFAVAVGYAALLTLRGLVQIHLIPATDLEPQSLGNIGFAGGTIWVFTVLVWSLSAALLGPILERIVAAIMYAYTFFPSLIIGGLMVVMLGGIRTSPVALHVSGDGARHAFAVMFHLVLAYATVGALGAADWGRVSRNGRDVRLGGLVGMGLAPAILCGITLVTIAGALGRTEADRADDPPDTAIAAPSTSPADRQPGPAWDSPLDYHQAVLMGQMRGPVGWALMTALALGLLGPACHAPARFRERLHNANRSIPAPVWAIAGALAASGLMLWGWALDLRRMFLVLGSLSAPLLGVLAGDALASRFRWPGRRAGVNLPSAIAWLAGVTIALGPLWSQGVLAGSPLTGAGVAAGTDPLWPTVLAGYVVSFAIALASGLIQLGSATLPEPDARREPQTVDV
jgi:hypothetical protein